MIRRTVQRKVNIDGESVRLDIDRLTVDEYEGAAALQSPKGTLTADTAAVVKQRLHYIDTHIEVVEGDLIHEDSGAIIRRVAHWLGHREDVMVLLFGALLNAQHLDEEEQEQLRIALHFTEWLQQAQADELPSDWVRTGTNCAKCVAKGLDQKRGCNGVQVKKVVWHYRKVRMRTCPVMSFTVDVERALRQFYWTHTIRSEGGTPLWSQTFLPNGPVLSEQEAWSMSALAFLRNQANEILSYEIKKRQDVRAER